MKMEQIRRMWAPTSGKISSDWLMGRDSTNPVMPAPTKRCAPENQTCAKMKHNENRRWKIPFFLGKFPSKAHVFFFCWGGWVENLASPVGRKIGPPKRPSQLGLLLFRRASSRNSKIMKQLKLIFFTPTDQSCGEHGGTWFCGRCLVETSDRFTDRLGSELKWADGKPLQCRQWCRIIQVVSTYLSISSADHFTFDFDKFVSISYFRGGEIAHKNYHGQSTCPHVRYRHEE